MTSRPAQQDLKHEYTNPLSPNGAAAAPAKYVVLNGHTLCYRLEKTPAMLGVLAGSVLRGGHNPMYGPVSFTQNCTLRDATQADFDDFRVSSKGHIS